MRVHIYVHDMTTTTTTTMYTSYDDGVARKLLSKQRRRPERLVFFINKTYRRPIPLLRIGTRVFLTKPDPAPLIPDAYCRICGARSTAGPLSRVRNPKTRSSVVEKRREKTKKYSRLATTTLLSAEGGRCIYHIVYTCFTLM